MNLASMLSSKNSVIPTKEQKNEKKEITKIQFGIKKEILMSNRIPFSQIIESSALKAESKPVIKEKLNSVLNCCNQTKLNPNTFFSTFLDVKKNKESKTDAMDEYFHTTSTPI